MVRTYDKKKDINIQLSKNFKLSEFDCKCKRPECSIVLLDDALVDILQKIREHFGVSITVNSGHRCKKHNAEVGGSTTSHHMRGMAADIRVKGVAPEEVAKYAESIGIKRIGLYDEDHGYFVHIGSAITKNYWKNTSANKVNTFGGAPEPEKKEENIVEVKLPVLARGSKADAVKSLQNLLIGHGYQMLSTDGKTNYGADGSFGGATERAIAAYQKDKKLPVTKKADETTWKSLLRV